MSSATRRLVTQGGVYALGNAFAKASGLLIVPLYLAALSQEGYGHLGLLQATAQIGIPLAQFGLTSALLTFLTTPDGDRADGLAWTTAATSALTAAAVALALWVGAGVLAEALLDDAGRTAAVRLVGAYVAFKVVQNTPLMVLRYEERVGLYVGASVVETVLLVAVTYVTMVPLGMGLEGALWGLALSAGATAAGLTAWMAVRVPLRFDARAARRLLRFGAPLVLGTLALPVIHVGDRYMLKAFASADVVAVYDLAARVSGVLNVLVVQSFQQAFSVVGLKALGEGATGRTFFRDTFRHYAVGTGWVALGLSLGAHDLIVLISPADKVDAYLGAAPMVFPLALGFLAYGLFTAFVNVLFAARAPRVVAATLVAAVAANLALNVALIPALGGLGAALATLLAYALMAAMTGVAAERRTPIGYPWRTLVVAGALSTGLWLCGLLGADWPAAARVAYRAGLVSAYPLAVVALGVYSREEVVRLAGSLRARWGRREHDGSTAGEAPPEPPQER